MILSDRQIRQRLAVGDLRFTPDVEDKQIQPASVDLRLGPEIISFLVDRRVLDSRDPAKTGGMLHVNTEGHPFVIAPDQFMLARTLEWVVIPAKGARVPRETRHFPDSLQGPDETITYYDEYPPLVGRVEGRSSLARLGVAIEQAGFIDPGFEGHITLELHNAGSRPVLLYPGDRICQLVLFPCGPVDRPYGSEALGSKYQKQFGVMPSLGM